MESDAVAAVRRRLDAAQREHVDRLELATRQVEQTRKASAEANAQQMHNVQRLVERLRESATNRAAKVKQQDLDFGVAEDEPERTFTPPPRPQRAAEFDESGFEPAPKPTPRRSATRRAAKQYEDDDYYADQSWLQ